MTTAPTAKELRKSLYNDITSQADFFGSNHLEVSADFLLLFVFTDVSIPQWCKALGITYEIELAPNPEFRSNATIRFSAKLNEDFNEDEL